MKICDSQAPCQQLFTLSLETEFNKHMIWPKIYSICRRRCSLLRHLVADLSAVTAFPWRNLSDGLFQLCHEHFIEHQEGMSEDWQKILKSMKANNNNNTQSSTTRWLHLMYKLGKWWQLYLLRVGHDEVLSSFEAFRCCGIPSPAISSTAFRTSVTCARYMLKQGKII